MIDWQPIHTAPKDRVILLYNNWEGPNAVHIHIYYRHHEVVQGKWYVGYGEKGRWMPTSVRKFDDRTVSTETLYPTHWAEIGDLPKERKCLTHPQICDTPSFVPH